MFLLTLCDWDIGGEESVKGSNPRRNCQGRYRLAWGREAEVLFLLTLCDWDIGGEESVTGSNPRRNCQRRYRMAGVDRPGALVVFISCIFGRFEEMKAVEVGLNYG